MKNQPKEEFHLRYNTKYCEYHSSYDHESTNYSVHKWEIERQLKLGKLSGYIWENKKDKFKDQAPRDKKGSARCEEREICHRGLPQEVQLIKM